MSQKKTLQELTIKDNFMFGAVMCDEENCKQLLEMILEIPIERIEVNKEKCIVYHPQYKGVRLDIYAKDEMSTRYNVEMQALKKEALPKRGRYYHSQIDMELLRTGLDYSYLPNSYVIFICDFDPFGEGKYRYTIQNRCEELNYSVVDDGNVTIFMSTKGTNKEDVSEELVSFLNYVSANLEESTANFEDEYVLKLQRAVSSVKSSREMESRYMIFKEMLQDEWNEGRAEGRAESIIMFLSELGDVPKTLEEEILAQKDLSITAKWIKLAARSETIEMFEKQMYI